MAVLYSPEWLAETALLNLVQPIVAIQNFYISDHIDIRERPCVTIVTESCAERKIGVMATRLGGYQSGVFDLAIRLALELKADFIVKPSQNANPEEEAAKLWMQIWQALHWDTLLQDRLTASSAYPFKCWSATCETAEESVDSELRIWRKSLTVKMIAMANRTMS